MRTTIAIDDDVVLHARRYAWEKKISLGAAISRLLRDGIHAQRAPRVSKGRCKSPYGLLPARDEAITNDHVRRLMDEEGI